MKSKTYSAHPACKLFSKIVDDDLQEFADDIKQKGCKTPIVLHNGKILDGRNRLAACKRARIKPRFEKWDGKGSPVEWVISQNLVRRHLTATQRAVIAHDLLPLLEKEAKERQRRSNSYRRSAQDCADRKSKGKASEVACSITRCSARYVEVVKSINGSAYTASVYRCGAVRVSRRHNMKPIVPLAASTVSSRLEPWALPGRAVRDSPPHEGNAY